MASDIGTPTRLYHELMDNWELVDDLMQGTKQMRYKAQIYLPKHPLETGADYERRLRHSFLFNVFKRTIRSLRGKVFSNPILLDETTPSEITEWSRNIDLQGRDLTSFCSNVFTDALVYGVGYILVSFPRSQAGLNVTRADNLIEGSRPYFIHISPKDLIGWRFNYSEGPAELAQARFIQRLQMEVDDYDAKEYERIWLLEPGNVEVWQQIGGPEGESVYVREESYQTTLDAVPLVPVYTNQTGDFQAHPPLEDLAYLNVAHYQSASDQRWWCR